CSPRAPGELGTHLALTAGRAGAEDALVLGLADAVVAADAIGGLTDALRAGTPPDEAIAAAAAAVPPIDLPAGTLAEDRAWIDEAYGGDSAETILARLDAAGESNAAAARAPRPRCAAPLRPP
ncbi:MAG: enoyl-CoA hydratase/isomerase family protein, partial [Patulibacter minatonensis]